MKVRDSGMPSAESWERFFDAPATLAALSLTPGEAEVVDFGCGYGTFTTAAAKLTTGMVYALDIDPAMTQATTERAASLGLSNVRAIERDFVSTGSGLPSESVDYAMLFNILHAEDPLTLLGEAFRILRPPGKVAVIHWIHDPTTPRGPALSIRPRSEQCRRWMQDAGFELLLREVALPPYHYGIVGQKPLAQTKPLLLPASRRATRADCSQIREIGMRAAWRRAAAGRVDAAGGLCQYWPQRVAERARSAERATPICSMSKTSHNLFSA